MIHEPSVLILNVSDNTGRHAIARILKDAGYTVIQAATGVDALQQGAQQHPDLIFLNARLPDSDGIARALKADPATRLIPILYLAADNADSETIARVLDAGADSYLSKPVDKQVLLAMVKALLRARQRQQAEEELTEELEQQQATLESVLMQMPAGVVMADATGKVVGVNHQAEELSGGAIHVATQVGYYPRLRAFRLDGSEFLPEDWQSARALRTGEAVPPEEVILERPDGSRTTVLASSAPIRNAKGTIVAVAVVFYDITDRLKIEEELRKRESMLTQAGEIAHFGGWYIDFHNVEDLRGNPLNWSDEVYRIFGYEPGSVTVTNKLFFERVHPDDRQRVIDAVANAIEHKQPYTFQHRIIRPDSTERIVQEHAEIEFDERGKPLYIVGAVQDITEYIEQRERLLAAERARAEIAEKLSSEISHRVKNNLAMVAGLLQMQMMNAQDTEGVEALRAAVSRVLTFSKVHEQMYSHHGEDVEMLSALQEIGRTLVDTFAALKQVEINVQGSPFLCNARTATNLSVIANELMTNALKYGAAQEDGQHIINVRLDVTEKDIRLSVWNSGNPVPEGFVPQCQQCMGLKLVRDIVAHQYRGSLELRPYRAGTLAEVIIPQERIQRDLRPR